MYNTITASGRLHDFVLGGTSGGWWAVRTAVWTAPACAAVRSRSERATVALDNARQMGPLAITEHSLPQEDQRRGKG